MLEKATSRNWLEFAEIGSSSVEKDKVRIKSRRKLVYGEHANLFYKTHRTKSAGAAGGPGAPSRLSVFINLHTHAGNVYPES
jgi:hypothetical protein